MNWFTRYNYQFDLIQCESNFLRRSSRNYLICFHSLQLKSKFDSIQGDFKKPSPPKATPIYEDPLVEYQPQYQDDLKLMKEMGLPLGFANGHYDVDEEDRLIRPKFPKKQRKKKRKVMYKFCLID